MSLTATNWAFARMEAVQISPAARMILVTLAHHHNQETGRCNPSVDRLSKVTQYAERTIRAALKELCELKLIRLLRRRKKVNGVWRQDTNSVIFQGADLAKPRVQNLHPNIEDTPSAKKHAPQPSRPYDLAMVLEQPDEPPACDHVACDEIPDEIPLEEMEAYSNDEHERPIPRYPVYPKAQEWLARCFEKFADKDPGEKVPHPRNGNSYLGRGLLHV